MENASKPVVDNAEANKRVDSVAASIYDVMREAIKVDKARNNVASHLLTIAREAADRVLFAKASKTAEAIWRNKTKGLKLPKAFIQARSDINRFFLNEISFYSRKVKDDSTIEETPRTYSEMGKAYRKEKAESDTQEKNKVEAEKPAGMREYEGMYGLILTAPGIQDAFLHECAVLLREAFTAWRENNPAPAKGEGEVDESEESEVQSQAA